MSKVKLVFIDSAKEKPLFTVNSINCLNLNSLVKKNFNEKSILSNLLVLQTYNEINLCNLCSLCSKLEIDYKSFDCLMLLSQLTDWIRQINPYIKFTQYKIENCLEVDMQPLQFTIKFDEINSIIYINKILKDILNTLGYSDCQLAEIIQTIKDITQIIPKDKLTPIMTSPETMLHYNKVKEIINC